MENQEHVLCQDFVEFMTGELSDVQRKRFEHHLQTCAVCRDDAAEWRLVWDRLADEAELMEPPAELKQEVMNAIFSKTDKTPHIQARPEISRLRRSLRWLSLTAALILAFLAGSLWNDLRPASSPSVLPPSMPPSQIEKLVSLKAAADNPSYTPGKAAYGVACLLRSEGERQLVVYTFGGVQTEGQSVYQVWLWKDGKRSSAGTFTVGSSGIGLLTVPWPDSSQAFDKVGITLEPDNHSVAPRGGKLFNSV